MSRLWALFAACVLVSNPAFAGSKAADYLVAEQIASACDGKPGKIDPAAAIEQDLTGDGKPDLIISHDGITCPGDQRSSFCGMQVCSVLIYVRRGALLELEIDMLGADVKVYGGRIPQICMRAHGHPGGCFRWDGQKFR